MGKFVLILKQSLSIANPQGLHVSEVIIVVNIAIAAVIVLLHHHRTVVLRRIFIILGLLYIYRSVTMSITVLPKSDRSYPCAPKLNHTIIFTEPSYQ